MTAADVLEVVGRFDAGGLWHCIVGGWGVDALLGEQMREHSNLDVGLRLEEWQAPS